MGARLRGGFCRHHCHALHGGVGPGPGRAHPQAGGAGQLHAHLAGPARLAGAAFWPYQSLVVGAGGRGSRPPGFDSHLHGPADYVRYHQ